MHLDQVSTTRPIFIYHASGHLATVNSAMLTAHQVTKDIQVEGLGRDADGELDGELQSHRRCHSADPVTGRFSE